MCLFLAVFTFSWLDIDSRAWIPIVACVLAGALIVFVYIFHQVLNQLPVLREDVTPDDVEIYLGKLDGKSLDDHHEQKASSKAKSLTLAKPANTPSSSVSTKTTKTTKKATKASTEEKKTEEEPVISSSASSSASSTTATSKKKGGKKKPPSKDVEMKSTMGGGPSLSETDGNKEVHNIASTLNDNDDGEGNEEAKDEDGGARRASSIYDIDGEDIPNPEVEFTAPSLSLYNGPSFTW